MTRRFVASFLILHTLAALLAFFLVMIAPHAAPMKSVVSPTSFGSAFFPN